MATAVFTSHGQWFDDSGRILSGGKIYVYDEGTTTPRAVYSDTALTVAAANPIILDSAGRHDNRYISTGSYKIVVKTSADVQVFVRDKNDGGVPVGSGALAVENGGTGATTPSAALSNLGGATSSELAVISAQVASVVGALGSSEKTHIATGTTAQRPAAPAEGDLRRNTTTSRWEGRNASGWENVLTDTEFASNADALAGTSTTKPMTPAATKAANPLQSLLFYVQDEKAGGTDGGDLVPAGSWLKRTLNAVSTNEITGASLNTGTSVITLPAGTYFAEARAPGYRVRTHQIKLRDTTNSADLALGSSAYAENGVGAGTGNSCTDSVIKRRFTLTGTTNIELQHRVESQQSTNGAGPGNSWGTNIYAQVWIYKVG